MRWLRRQQLALLEAWAVTEAVHSRDQLGARREVALTLRHSQLELKQSRWSALQRLFDDSECAPPWHQSTRSSLLASLPSPSLPSSGSSSLLLLVVLC